VVQMRAPEAVAYTSGASAPVPEAEASTSDAARAQLPRAEACRSDVSGLRQAEAECTPDASGYHPRLMAAECKWDASGSQ
jgi:hypothetical protein